MNPEGSPASRLVIGTAQLGMDYGIANKTGRPDMPTATAIISAAWEGGVREFDTAQGYGQSEAVLGHALKSMNINDEVNIVSKFHPAMDHNDYAELRKALEQSLIRLGTSKLHGIMLHRENLLDAWAHGLGKCLRQFIDEGLVEHLGVSVYSPQKAIQGLKTSGIDIVQIPSNIIDRRFEKAEVFGQAEDRGKTIYVRSVFLQGLLLLSVDALPAAMRFASPVIERVVNFAEETGLSVKQLAIGYVRGAYPRQKVVLGCEKPEQIKEILKLCETELPGDIIQNVQQRFQDVPEKILNPSFWNQNSTAQPGARND